ncbi:ATP-grasp domain-containing protein [Vibrio gigantis]
MFKSFLRDIIINSKYLKNHYAKVREKNGEIIAESDIYEFLDEAEPVFIEREKLKKDFIVGIVNEGVQYEGYAKLRDYNPKYRRFLTNNQIKFEDFNIFSNDWQEYAEKYDLIVWHTDSTPSLQKIAFDKIYFLERIMKKKCYPSVDEIWSYEDKVNCNYIYEKFDLPKIKTFITHDLNEANDYVKKAKYPIISKINTGSSSFGVAKLDNFKQALKLIKRSFSYKGVGTYFPYSNQKDYVYFQDFVVADYDLRVIVVGDKAFGYYRYPKERDFKASGSGIYEKKAIPVEALNLAFKVKESFGSTMLATDLLFNKESDRFEIIESSIFIGIDSCEQLVVDGIPGYYKKQGDNYSFMQGKYWLQEFVLEELIKNIKEL